MFGNYNFSIFKITEKAVKIARWNNSGGIFIGNGKYPWGGGGRHRCLRWEITENVYVLQKFSPREGECGDAVRCGRGAESWRRLGSTDTLSPAHGAGPQCGGARRLQDSGGPLGARVGGKRAEARAAATQSVDACCLQVCLWRTEDFLVIFISSLNIGNKL